MKTVTIHFRVPAGQELSDARIEALETLGFDSDHVTIEEPGVIALSFAQDETKFAQTVEERAKAILQAIPDMSIEDYEDL